MFVGFTISLFNKASFKVNSKKKRESLKWQKTYKGDGIAKKEMYITK